MNATRCSMSRRLAAALAAVALVLVATPQTAEADGTSPLVLEGEAALPEFPCPLPPPPDPPCAGTFEGTISGELEGVHMGNAWTVTLAEVPITADFSYSDGNCARGTASGAATAAGGADNVVGTYDKGGPLPRLITGITITAAFEWSRDGVTALVVPINNGQVTVDLFDDGPRTVMASAVGGGEAAFAPHIEPGDEPDCVGGTNSPPITADVAGTVTLADPT